MVYIIWALKFPRNLSEIEMFGFWTYVQNMNIFCLVWALKAQPKQSVQNPSNFVPFVLSKKCPKFKWNRLDFGQCPNTEPSGIGPKVDHLKSKLVRILDIHCISKPLKITLIIKMLAEMHLFLMLTHPVSFLSLLLFTYHIFFHILSNDWALYSNRAATFQYF